MIHGLRGWRSRSHYRGVLLAFRRLLPGLLAASIFTQPAVDDIRLAAFDRAFGVVAIGADSGARRAVMFDAGLLVHVVARNAGWKLCAVDNHVANVLQDVPVAGVQALIIGFREVHFVVQEQIITRNKVVRIRQSVGSRFSCAQMALRTR